MSEPSPAPARWPTAVRRWLGLTAVALAVPLLGALADPLADPLRHALAPSPSAGWALALTALLGGIYLGLLRWPEGRGFWRGAAAGLALAGVVAVVASGVTAADGAAAVGGCSGAVRPVAGTIDARAAIDGTPRGGLDGVPDGGHGLTTVLAGLAGAPFEDHGVEEVTGVASRRCSVPVDGSQALTAFPPLRQLVGEPDRAVRELPVWRGELEWWSSADGRLVLARVRVGGHPADAWASRGLRGELAAEFRPARAAAP